MNIDDRILDMGIPKDLVVIDEAILRLRRGLDLAMDKNEVHPRDMDRNGRFQTLAPPKNAP